MATVIEGWVVLRQRKAILPQMLDYKFHEALKNSDSHRLDSQRLYVVCSFTTAGTLRLSTLCYGSGQQPVKDISQGVVLSLWVHEHC